MPVYENPVATRHKWYQLDSMDADCKYCVALKGSVIGLTSDFVNVVSINQASSDPHHSCYPYTGDALKNR